MATWRDQMGPAKFRGVKFFISTAETTGGRRGPVHEYPFKRVGFKEDMGAKARSFPVDGYVVGSDYLDQKNALITALDTEGPGELVHPYYGTLRVSVESFRVRESSDRGGLAEFSIEFVQTESAASAPVAVTDAAATVRSSAATALEAVKAQFLSDYSPGVLLDSVSAQVTNAVAAVRDVVHTAQREEQKLALFARRADLIDSNVIDLVEHGEDLYDSLFGLFELLDSPTALAEVYGFDAGVRPPSTTPNREQEQACFDASQALIQRMAVISAASVAPSQAYESYESAVEARELITALLDDQAETVPDEVYPLLFQLRADLVNAVPGAGSDLPHLIRHTPAFTVPSLVLAHRLYGNVDSEADLIARNGISHPGFVAGGVELEVLSDEE